MLPKDHRGYGGAGNHCYLAELGHDTLHGGHLELGGAAILAVVAVESSEPANTRRIDDEEHKNSTSDDKPCTLFLLCLCSFSFLD